MAKGRNLPAGLDRGMVTTVHQGECLVSGDADLAYSTVLGSCVSACVRDVEARIGGMNHFLLSEQPENVRDRYGESARYGAYAMEQLINMVLTRGTGRKTNLEIKVFGGGTITTVLSDIGASNAGFVRDFLGNEGYRIAGEDLGGAYARRVMYRPHTGRAFVKRLDAATGETIARGELALAVRRIAQPEIELF